MASEIHISDALRRQLPGKIVALIEIYNAEVKQKRTDRSRLINFFDYLKKEYGKGSSWIQSGPSKRLSAFLGKFSKNTFLKEGGVSLNEVEAALKDIMLYYTGGDELGTWWKTGKRMHAAIIATVKQKENAHGEGYSRFPRHREVNPIQAQTGARIKATATTATTTASTAPMLENKGEMPKEVPPSTSPSYRDADTEKLLEILKNAGVLVEEKNFSPTSSFKGMAVGNFIFVERLDHKIDVKVLERQDEYVGDFKRYAKITSYSLGEISDKKTFDVIMGIIEAGRAGLTKIVSAVSKVELKHSLDLGKAMPEIHVLAEKRRMQIMLQNAGLLDDAVYYTVPSKGEFRLKPSRDDPSVLRIMILDEGGKIPIISFDGIKELCFRETGLSDFEVLGQILEKGFDIGKQHYKYPDKDAYAKWQQQISLLPKQQPSDEKHPEQQGRTVPASSSRM